MFTPFFLIQLSAMLEQNILWLVVTQNSVNHLKVGAEATQIMIV